MKTYKAIEIQFVKDGKPMEGNEDFGKVSAVKHRILKNVSNDQTGFLKSRSEAFDAKKTELGKGGFKTIYELKNNSTQFKNDAFSFVIARMQIDYCDQYSRDSLGEDVIKQMIVYGNPKMTYFISNKKNSALGDESRPVYKAQIYIPKIEGKDLDKVISLKQLTKSDSILIFLQIYKQVTQLHEAGYYHQDLKPANVMLSADNKAYLIDFGSMSRIWNTDVGAFTEVYCFFSGFREANVQNALGHYEDKVYMDQSKVTLFTEAFKSAGTITKLRALREKSYYGISYDNGSMAIILLQLKLITKDNEDEFLKFVESTYHPYYLLQLIGKLEQESGLKYKSLFSPLNVIEPDDIKISRDESNGFDPQLAINTWDYLVKDKNRAWKFLEENNNQNNDSYQASKDIFNEFKRNNHLYQNDTQRTTSKSVALYHLINLLSYANNRTDIRLILTKIFLVSLVNTGFINKTFTESFQILYRMIFTNVRLKSIIGDYYWSGVNLNPSQQAFRDHVISQADMFEDKANIRFIKGNRYAVIEQIMSGVRAIGPSTKANVLSTAQKIRTNSSFSFNKLFKNENAITSEVYEEFHNHVSEMCIQTKDKFEGILGKVKIEQWKKIRNEISDIYVTKPS